MLCLQEPAKDQQLLFRAGRLRSLPRLAFCILQTPPELVVIEALVDLRSHAAAAAVVSWGKVGVCGRSQQTACISSSSSSRGSRQQRSSSSDDDGCSSSCGVAVQDVQPWQWPEAALTSKNS
jgi:hypothetical protein